MRHSLWRSAQSHRSAGLTAPGTASRVAREATVCRASAGSHWAITSGWLATLGPGQEDAQGLSLSSGSEKAHRYSLWLGGCLVGQGLGPATLPDQVSACPPARSRVMPVLRVPRGTDFLSFPAPCSRAEQPLLEKGRQAPTHCKAENRLILACLPPSAPSSCLARPSPSAGCRPPGRHQETVQTLGYRALRPESRPFTSREEQ